MVTSAIKLDLKDKDRFVGHNYGVWAHRLKTILQIEEVWDIVNGTTALPTTLAATQVDNDAWKKKDLCARLGSWSSKKSD